MTTISGLASSSQIVDFTSKRVFPAPLCNMWYACWRIYRRHQTFCNNFSRSLMFNSGPRTICWRSCDWSWLGPSTSMRTHLSAISKQLFLLIRIFRACGFVALFHPPQHLRCCAYCTGCCEFSVKLCDFSELCQFCCSASDLPAWCVYTHWHQVKTEKGQSSEYSKIFWEKKQYLMNTLYNN